MNTQPPTSELPRERRRRLIRAAAVVDAEGIAVAPGAVLLDGETIVAAGSPQEIGEAADAESVDFPDSIIVPALANAHAHLDLTHIRPQPFGGDFTRWVDRIRTGRARDDAGIATSVRDGVRLSRTGGTAIAGDIAGARSTVPTRTMRESKSGGLGGVSFFECFGVGRTQQAAIDLMTQTIRDTPAIERGVRFGLQPHAPYSCGSDVYRFAAKCGLALSTHLAETREELEFIRSATGPLAEMLKRIGAWDDSIVAANSHPIDHIARLIGDRPCIAAHLNYIDDAHLATFARSNITVAFCPRASAYFGHTDHRYREMLHSGINVALGTDSIICLDTPDRISTLDEMRFLHQRDGVDPVTLLRMATINGARALGVRESLMTLAPGDIAGLLALRIDAPFATAREALAIALRRNDPPRWVLGPIEANNGWFT